MNNQQLENPIAKTGMLIRKPVSEVFEAFINPDITTKFWFTKSSGKLEEGKQVEWIWEMYDFKIPVNIKKIESKKKIIIEWGNYQQMTTVEWTFESINNQATYVTIINSGFQGNLSQLVAQISDSTKGFSFLLAGLKAYLEHHVQLNLVADAFPNQKLERELQD